MGIDGIIGGKLTREQLESLSPFLAESGKLWKKKKDWSLASSGKKKNTYTYILTFT